MNQQTKTYWTKKFLPHGVALVVFLGLTIAYFYPAFQGYSIKQGDIASYIGMAKEHNDYRAETGEEALWTNAMFGGMPTFQIGLLHQANLLTKFDKLLQLGLPHGVAMAFYYFLGFYILLLCMKINPWLAIVGALAFAYSSYFYIILEAGHLSKAHAIALMGPVLGGAILVYRGKLFAGTALFTLFFGLELLANHFQMTFYFAFVLLFFGLYQLFAHVKNKDLSSFFKKTGLLVIGVAVAIGANSGRMLTTYEYAKETIRGKTELSADLLGKNKAESSGLSTDYITQWSYGIGETYSLLVPNVKGGASGALFYDDVVNSFQGRGKAKKEAIKNLDKVDPQLKNYVITQLQKGQSVNTYWGAQPFTSGPVYIGAIVLFLFVLSFALWKSNLKWFFLPLILLVIGLSWGKNFLPLTEWFIENMPMYNKFRAVSMILVIVEFLVPIFAIAALDRVLKDKEVLIRNKTILFVLGALFIATLLVVMQNPPLFFNFLSARELFQFAQENNQKIVEALVDYRIGEFRSDSFRSLFFILITIGLLYAYATNKLKQNLFIGLLGLAVLVDLWSVNKRYLNNEKQGKEYFSWQKEAEKFAPYHASKADLSILQRELNLRPDLNVLIDQKVKEYDRPKGMNRNQFKESVAFGALNLNTNYRVYKLGGNAFQESATSYYHKSIGGYHAAKLKRYQELVDFALNSETQELTQSLNALGPQAFAQAQVLNMLNMKYLIYSPEQAALKNDFANGNAWFVDSIWKVESADQEILALSNPKFDSKKQAVVQAKFLNDEGVVFSPSLSQGKIELTSYSPNAVQYSSSNKGDGIAVFSEVYYDKGWKAYIDGKQVNYVKANYVLRGLVIPAGDHEIEFVFEPSSFTNTQWLSYLCSALILAFAFLAAFKWFKKEQLHA